MTPEEKAALAALNRLNNLLAGYNDTLVDFSKEITELKRFRLETRMALGKLLGLPQARECIGLGLPDIAQKLAENPLALKYDRVHSEFKESIKKVNAWLKSIKLTDVVQ